METLDKKQIKKDLEHWAEKMRKIMAMQQEIYADWNEIYKSLLEQIK